MGGSARSSRSAYLRQSRLILPIMNTLLIGLRGVSPHLFQRLAKECNVLPDLQINALERKTFPDGETYLRFTQSTHNGHLILVGNTNDDTVLVEMHALAWQAVHDGVAKITVVIPYFGYSTMERATKEGEVVRAKTQAVLLSHLPKPPQGIHIVVCDLHSEGIPHYFEQGIKVTHLYAQSLFVRYLSERNIPKLVLGTADSGRIKWVESYAKELNVEMAFILKRRDDATHTEIQGVGGASVRGKTVFLFDDMIRTGGSIAKAVETYKKAHAREVIVGTTHLILTRKQPALVLKRIAQAGASCIVTTDTAYPLDGHASVSELPIHVLSLGPKIARLL